MGGGIVLDEYVCCSWEMEVKHTILAYILGDQQSSFTKRALIQKFSLDGPVFLAKLILKIRFEAWRSYKFMSGSPPPNCDGG